MMTAKEAIVGLHNIANRLHCSRSEGDWAWLTSEEMRLYLQSLAILTTEELHSVKVTSIAKTRERQRILARLCTAFDIPPASLSRVIDTLKQQLEAKEKS